MNVTALVVAKAPVPGLAKTRLAATVGADAAADIAAAALLDTLDAVADADFATRVVALTGDLDAAARGTEIAARLASYTVVRQRGDGFAERLVNAHMDAFHGLPVFQIGMDTPQVTPELLNVSASRLTDGQSVLGMAEDGGWWALGIPDPSLARALLDVPMSTPETGAETLAALTARGAEVTMLDVLRDVDHASDLAIVAADCPPGGRFALVSAIV
ncbi:DUF2064 domain-containing protein [Rhodococcus sp. BP-252]|uniref:TIGR04282 family arsenosugar biosynthesis glycosyltransferase n=1 Tax=unclassified Rhodococcus (in: high G+C Gram-positive bacteria) TaxID=192944 RepID=UPI00142F55CA|nr:MULTISPECIES: DUF2064 domain-containing protein [unclassified Rhodococcus (in: high G+C Gram-positive bacteria)]NIL75873.1 hypothetical protein [Rhodococcus sp. B10]MBY6413745.1 DUF2064 domain-containing protein [Rhodococcus sp. BP-320]MBY6418474.1 DUF2064 domain-containing protein [Rhodococcus sp. BP-321]MBY6422599.1 DUF2064 domain-containing protein [Rhodococcus sp. BP-324]MBY6428384.1 DUF2064 domain-containing protein [Rhodococcus sp. BP-323]